MLDLSNVRQIRVPTFYTCTGEESGICEAHIDDKIWKIYIASARAGSHIMYLNGHFYAIDGGVDVTQPEAQDTFVDPDPEPNAPQSLPITNPDTGTTTRTIFDTPEVTLEPGDEIEYHVLENDGVVTVTYRISGTQNWIEIPVLTDEDVLRILNGFKVVSANIRQVGSTVYLT